MLKRTLLSVALMSSAGPSLAHGTPLPTAASQTVLLSQSATLSHAAQAHINLAREDIAAGRSTQAYSRLAGLEGEYAGDVAFDYWLGVAAARSGEWFESSLALQRVLATQPRHAGARLELVGVYVQQNQLDRAELQLQTLQQLVDQGGAPQGAAQAIARYQDVIEQRRAGADTSPRVVMIGLDVGYDSNYLNYPDQFDIFANTIFEGLAIFDAEDTAYVGLRGSYWQQFSVRDDDFIELVVAGNSRLNADSDASDFNTHLVTSSLSYGTRGDNGSETRMGVELGTVLLDNSYYRAHAGFVLSNMRPISERAQWHNRVYLRSFKFDESRFNFNSYGFETSWRQQLTGSWSTRLSVMAEYEDTAKQPTRQGGDMWRVQTTARLDYQVNARHQLGAQLSMQNRRYQSEGFAVFNLGEARKRSDDALVARLDWNGQVSSRLRANAFAQWREQSSNVDFFDLDQLLIQGGVTYVF